MYLATRTRPKYYSCMLYSQLDSPAPLPRTRFQNTATHLVCKYSEAASCFSALVNYLLEILCQPYYATHGFFHRTCNVRYLAKMEGGGVRVPPDTGIACGPSTRLEAPSGRTMGAKRHPIAYFREHHRPRRRGESSSSRASRGCNFVFLGFVDNTVSVSGWHTFTFLGRLQVK